MWPSENFWTVLPQPLDVIKVALASGVSLEDSEIDAENRWEWIEGKDKEGREWNISRRWGADIDAASERLRIVVKPIPDDPKKMAQMIGAALGTKVSFGSVRYLTGDDFSYEERFQI